MEKRGDEEIIKLVHQITKAKNENDDKKLREFLAPGFVAHIAGVPRPVNREQYVEAIQCSHKSFSPLMFTVEDIILQGDRVAARILTKGKHTGDYQGFEASQHQVEYSGMIMRKVMNGKVIEEWQVYDSLTLLRQMGLSVNHII